MTQITANLMERTVQLTVPGYVTVFALDGLTKKLSGHYAFLKIFSFRSPRGAEHRAGYHQVISYSTSEDKCIVIDPFTKRHRLVHNGGSPKLEALYGSLNMVNSTEIS